jgi:hypothetical protein
VLYRNREDEQFNAGGKPPSPIVGEWDYVPHFGEWGYVHHHNDEPTL